MTIYYHETRDVLDRVPPLLQRFSLRALIVAQPGDIVILPDAPWPEELALLNRLGFGPRSNDVVCAPIDELMTSDFPILKDKEVHLMSGLTFAARIVASKQGMKICAPVRDVCLRANLKSTFQIWINKLGLRPAGQVCYLAEVKTIAKEMLEKYGKVVIKGDLAASGYEQVVLERGDEIPDCFSFSRETRKVVIQEWIPHTRSLSVHYEIEPFGRATRISMSEQILDGNHHLGNIFPTNNMSVVTLEKMLAQADLLASKAAAMGHWPYVGIDFIIDENGNPWPTEINARVYAPWYPWEAARKAFGKPIPFRLKGFSTRKNLTIEEVEEVFRPILFDLERKLGVVPFCFVPEHGFVFLVTYAPSPPELTTISQKTDELVVHLS